MGPQVRNEDYDGNVHVYVQKVWVCECMNMNVRYVLAESILVEPGFIKDSHSPNKNRHIRTILGQFTFVPLWYFTPNPDLNIVDLSDL